MKKCCKCKGDNFVKSGRSTVSPFLTYHLCECGNVMLSDSRFNHTFVPSPEAGRVAEVMMEDAAKALGLPADLFFKTQEEIEEKKEELAEMFANLMSQYEDEEEYDEEEENEEDETPDEEIEEFINFTDMIIEAMGDPILKSIWEKVKENGDIYDFIRETEESTGISLKELMDQKKTLIDSIPEELSQGKDKEEVLAKLTAIGIAPDMNISKDITPEQIDKLLSSIFDDEDAEEIEEDEECCEECCSCKTDSNSDDEEERKSYVVLERGAGWKLYRDVTKAEISKKINNDEELDEFLVFEVKPVKIGQEVKFTVM